MNRLFFFGLLFLFQSAFAQWTLKPQLGWGSTNNANFDENNKKSDLYWWFGQNSQYQSQDIYWNLNFNFRDYSKQDQNDRVQYRVSRTQSFDFNWSGNIDWLVGLGGQQYSGKSPAETEESFNHVYFDTAFIKTFTKGENFEFNFEPGIRIKSYTDLENRVDSIYYLSNSLDLDLGHGLLMHPYYEIGFDFSDKSDYTNDYFEIGLDWTWDVTTRWQVFLSSSFRETAYVERKTSTVTLVSKRRTKTVTSSENQNEAQGYVQTQLSLQWQRRKSQLIRASLLYDQQMSRSEITNYTEAQGQLSYLWSF